MQTGAPCIPVSVYGTEALMAKGSFGIKPGTAHFVFHAPIYPRDFETREAVDGGCARGDRLRPAGVDEKLKNRKIPQE